MSAKIGAIQAAREVLDKGFYGVPARRRLDATSAALVVQVAERLNERDRQQLDAMPVHKAALMCWQLIGDKK